MNCTQIWEQNPYSWESRTGMVNWLQVQGAGCGTAVVQVTPGGSSVHGGGVVVMEDSLMEAW